MNIVASDRRKIEFDKKLKQIESDERKLRALEQELMALQARMYAESSPLVEAFCEIRFETLTKLKTFLTDSFFKKKEKRQLVAFMVELAAGLRGAGDSRGEEFLDELLPRDPEPDYEEDFTDYSQQEFRPAPTAEKQLQGKIEIKSLFRQLAKAFHPDREPLEHLKEEKTSLMKKITAAYENQDLSGLLKLEKELMGPREFSEDKIELYIQHINDRIKELKNFKAKLTKTGPLAGIYQNIYSRKITILEYNIRNELMKIEDEVQREKDLQPLIWDRSSLRDFLKNI